MLFPLWIKITCISTCPTCPPVISPSHVKRWAVWAAKKRPGSEMIVSWRAGDGWGQLGVFGAVGRSSWRLTVSDDDDDDDDDGSDAVNVWILFLGFRCISVASSSSYMFFTKTQVPAPTLHSELGYQGSTNLACLIFQSSRLEVRSLWASYPRTVLVTANIDLGFRFPQIIPFH